MKHEFRALSVLMGLDVTSTFIGLALGAVEANPAPWARPEYMIPAKGVALAAVWGLGRVLGAWRPWVWYLRAVCAAMAAVVLNNAVVIAHVA